MKISDIKLNVSQISGNTDGSGILLSMAPGYEYEGGQKTNTQSHIKYETVFPDNKFEKVLVKVIGTKPIVAEEQLAQQSGKLRVKFKNLTGRFYRSNSGEYALSCSADSVEVIQ